MTKATSYSLQRAMRYAAGALVAASTLTLVACGGDDDTPVAATPERSVASLRLIGQQVLPRRVEFQGTVVGGLSGIDYDATNNRYTMVSDDRTTTDSANPPRMYTAALQFDNNTFAGVQLLSTFQMRQPNGAVYPKVPDNLVADPEGVRFDSATGNLVWVSEGDRTIGAPGTPNRIINPFIREITTTGTHVREYTLPAIFAMSANDVGPRGNAVFEGLAFTPDRSRLMVLMEGALFQDGPAPTLTAGAQTRITAFDRAGGAPIAQYVYQTDPVQVAPVPLGQFTVNGPTEILALSNTRFLVLERSFSVGVVGNQVRLYEIDITNASNVLNTAALTGATFTPVTKRLVLNFNSLATQLGGIANLEGMTFEIGRAHV